MATRDETIAKIEAFNRRAEELRQTLPPQPSDPPAIGLTDDQKKLMETPNVELTGQQRLEKQAIANTTELEKEQRIRDAAEQARQKSEEKNVQSVQDAGRSLASSAIEAAQPSIRWAENVPTPMGLGIILAIIVVFLMCVVPVNPAGDTRAKLIWYTITGKTSLNYAGTSGPVSGMIPPSGSNNNTSGTTNSIAQQVPIDLSNIPDLSGLDFTDL